MSEVKMGLGAPPDPIYLYVSESEDEQGNVHPWHLYDHDAKKQVPVKERALTGILTGVRMKMGPEFKGKAPVKIQLSFDTGEQPYVVQSGVDTTFTRGVLLALELIDDLTRPLMLVVANGGDKVVFGRIHRGDTKERVKVMWDKERKIFPLAQKIQTKLGGRAQTWDEIQATASSERYAGREEEEPPPSTGFDDDGTAPF